MTVVASPSIRPAATSQSQANTPQFWGNLLYTAMPQRSVAFWIAWADAEGGYLRGGNNPLSLKPGNTFLTFSSPLAGIKATADRIRQDYPDVLTAPTDLAAINYLSGTNFGTNTSIFQDRYRKYAGTTSSPSALFIPLSGIFTDAANVVYSGFGEANSYIGTIDQAGIGEFGAKLWHDLNYGGVPAGSTVKLPGSSATNYTFLKNESGPGKWGNLLYFRTPNGGIVGFTHLVNIGNLTPGQSVPGGTAIGQTAGWGAGLTAPYWTGPHLGVILDQTAAQWFNDVATGSASGGAFDPLGSAGNAIGGALGGAGNFIGGAFGGAGNAIGNLAGGITGIPGAIFGGFAGLASALENIFVRMGLVVLGLIAAVIGFKLLTGVSPPSPSLATGGKGAGASEGAEVAETGALV